MIPPDDWKEYEWRITSGLGAGTYSQIDARVWRILATTTAGGTITITNRVAPPPVGGSTIVTLLAGTSITWEPCGMHGLPITFSAGIDQWQVEWIRRVQ